MRGQSGNKRDVGDEEEEERERRNVVGEGVGAEERGSGEQEKSHALAFPNSLLESRYFSLCLSLFSFTLFSLSFSISGMTPLPAVSLLFCMRAGKGQPHTWSLLLPFLWAFCPLESMELVVVMERESPWSR